MKLPIAIQLYSVRDQLETDYFKTLVALKQMSYDGVELPGLNGLSGKEVKKMADDAGLQIISAHVPFIDMLEDPDGTFREYKKTGCSYIVVPSLPRERRPDGELFEKTIGEIRRLGKIARGYGISLLYHNHDFEFTRINGKYALDILYETVPPEYLGVELDTCWVKVAGEDPVRYLKKYAGRSDLVHLKDFWMEGELTEPPYELIGRDGTKIEKPERLPFSFRPVGHGMQDFPSIIRAAVEIGSKWLIVEQDRSDERPTLEAANMSVQYLRQLKI